MMAQYHRVKAEHQETLVFFRFGDFYEMFYDDAAIAARALDITLTSRPQGKNTERVPMCGVPHYRLDTYLSRLVEKGFKVAICEQLEGSQKGRGLLRREVVRVVTPGTLTEDTLLDARAHSYLAALAEAGGDLGLAWLDMTTGDFAAQPVAPGDLGAALGGQLRGTRFAALPAAEAPESHGRGVLRRGFVGHADHGLDRAERRLVRIACLAAHAQHDKISRMS